MAQKDPIFADRLRRLRQSLEFEVSQKKLAERIGISVGTYQRAEWGIIPGIEILDKIARFFDVTVGWLLTGEEPRHLQDIKSGIMRPPDALHAQAQYYKYGNKTYAVTAFGPGTAGASVPQEPSDEELMQMTGRILDSHTVFRNTLISNILTFHQAIETENRLRILEQRIKALEVYFDTEEAKSGGDE